MLADSSDPRAMPTSPLVAIQTQEDVYIGIDFGTGAIRAAFTEGSRPPEQIPMVETHDVNGGLVASYLYPISIWFKGPGEFELLGHRKMKDFENIASGVKQSLDTNLCEDGGQGERFMALCKKYQVDNLAVVSALFTTTLDQITRCLGSKDCSNIVRVNLTVPVIWTLDKHGEKIQEKIEKIAVGAGFPKGKICFDTEPGSAMAYLARKYGSKRGRRRVFLIDIGAGTVDFAGAQIEDGGILLISDPRGCGGGMADGWAALQRFCFEMTGDADTAAVLFQGARDHVYEMGEACEPFILGRHRISAEAFQQIIYSSYEKAFQMAHREFRKIPNLDVVTISGSATASNAYIRALWLGHVEEWRKERKLAKRKASFKVDVLKSEDAARAVCMGASIPYSENPIEEFQKHCFGILCVNDHLNRFPKGLLSKGKFIIEIKSENSEKLETRWEKLKVYTTPDDFTIEPHIITHGKPLAETYNSPDTNRPLWPTDNAMPMNPVVLDLSGLVNTGDDVLVRFTSSGPTALSLEVANAGGGNDWLEKVDLELGRDRDRLFLTEEGRQGANSERTSSDQANREEAGQQNVERNRLDPRDPYEVPSDEDSSAIMLSSERKQKLPNEGQKRPQPNDDSPHKRRKSFFEVIGINHSRMI